MSQKIFISYRRDDSADVTGRIYDRLVEQFGRENIFKDVDSIPFGVDFKEHLTEAVQQCAIQLVVIGRDWLTIADKNGRRLDDPRDFVRIEIEAALSRKIPVIPLLVMGAGMPDESRLPSSLVSLVYRNGTAIRRDPDFHNDMNRLIKGLVTHFDKPVTPPVVPPSSQPIMSVLPKPAIIQPKFTLPMLEWMSIPAGEVTVKQEFPQTYYVEAFYISKYPITYSQFQAFVNDDGYEKDRWWEGLAKRETKPAEASWPIHNHPRETVNWFEAVAFTRWLSVKTGLNIFLPTGNQWQRAAQGDDGRDYPWGYNFDKSLCNTRESGIGKSTPVDRYPLGASPYGVVDMSGNVWEWLRTNTTNMNFNEMMDKFFALHGGSWLHSSESARIDSVTGAKPDLRNYGTGFRVVVDVESTNS